MKACFVGMLLVSVSVLAAPVPDIQEVMAEEVKKDGVLLVRNDVYKPYEVHTYQIGKHLLCLTNDFSKGTLYPITKDTFLRGEVLVLVRCRNGRFHIGRGYV